MATEHIRHLEGAMVDGRRWRVGAHRKTIVEQPGRGEPARRLVWAIVDADDAVTESFRIERDGGYVDPDGRVLAPADDTLVRIAHPLELADGLDRWRAVFADRGLSQPFAQLDREVYTLTPAEAASNRLARFDNRRVRTGRVFGLQQYGWVLADRRAFRRVDARHQVTLTLDHGIRGGFHDDPDELRIFGVEVSGGVFGALEPVAASELLRQLERLSR
ncbi:Uncharacterised protein [Nocardia otitidiscaviarum]|uniref:DUF4132 domain-containing protein n=1 Tax=Nocardia otitidiscaviarum TaxID=1823 RepID=A0A379JIQ5_9NOCA|nr:DUF4132 domain-containing protein [Nocardia otitidiscaviarum]SUD47873.1 Uncharacterised protein [Nocardia otitidiscaviarum]